MSEIERKYQICVSGAEQVQHCCDGSAEKAQEIGRQIALQGGVLFTGACWGMPYESVIGAKEAGGISVGVSPAISEEEHYKLFKMPVSKFDMIFFTGFGFSARNVWLMRMAEATIFICGRMGTLNEFTICFEDDRLIGVLEGTGGATDMIKDIVKGVNKGTGRIIYDKDPKRLVEKICKAIDKERKEKRKTLFKGRTH